MMDEMQRIRKEAGLASSREQTAIHPENLTKTTKDLN
jgi:hypothetical protein